ncbi:MAG: hypothetical protein GFH27_549279n157 [Chloroflexi bacterium AL-W]|nr:hypothetical protein [Chloroflexi bacterium AL-N1]NOK65123.1 hypothetical protein [Chloroflexi bacterium AL-N10]NOK72610.1 hypothetical protein [Chloroflexi bacterium AL-N5]NOK79302.1 hypothetical protein [Chloroflexi bacterium AL-W]NOK87218.1 hypothetical protein [Chloroflexi bacterium AL-N15]
MWASVRSSLYCGEIAYGYLTPDEQCVVQTLFALRPESTACPGAVSHKLWPDVPTPERMMCSVCAGLCEQGLLRSTQRGEPVGCRGYRGPIRIALTDQGRALMCSRV